LVTPFNLEAATAWVWRAGYRKPQNISRYGLDGALLTDLSTEFLHRYHEVSRLWHLRLDIMAEFLRPLLLPLGGREGSSSPGSLRTSVHTGAHAFRRVASCRVIFIFFLARSRAGSIMQLSGRPIYFYGIQTVTD
jgi:hypothetical protein